jgi:hypothetical protein
MAAYTLPLQAVRAIHFPEAEAITHPVAKFSEFSVPVY